MATSASPKMVNEYPACTTPAATDVLLGKGNVAANTFKYSISAILGSNAANVIARNLILSNSATPSNGTPNTALKGTLSFDTNNIYIATANSVIKKIPLLAWGSNGYPSGLNVESLTPSASPAPNHFISVNVDGEIPVSASLESYNSIFSYAYGNTNLTLDSKIVWVNASNIPYSSGLDYFSSWIVKNGAISSSELTPDGLGKIRPDITQGKYFWFDNDGIELLAPNTALDYDITILVRNPASPTQWGADEFNVVHGNSLPVSTANGVWLCRAVQINGLSILTVTAISP